MSHHFSWLPKVRNCFMAKKKNIKKVTKIDIFSDHGSWKFLSELLLLSELAADCKEISAMTIVDFEHI